MLLSLMTSKKVRSVNVLKKRKEKCRQVAETNKLLKKKKKQEEFKKSEEAYWKRLGELNKQFKANKKDKKEAKKMYQTIMKM